MGHVMCVLGWCLHLSYKPKNFQSWNTTCNNYIWQTLNLNVYTHTHMHILTFIFFYFAFHKKLKKKIRKKIFSVVLLHLELSNSIWKLLI